MVGVGTPSLLRASGSARDEAAFARVRDNQQSAQVSLRAKRRIDGLKQSRVAEWFEQALDRTLLE